MWCTSQGCFTKVNIPYVNDVWMEDSHQSRSGHKRERKGHAQKVPEVGSSQRCLRSRGSTYYQKPATTGSFAPWHAGSESRGLLLPSARGQWLVHWLSKGTCLPSTSPEARYHKRHIHFPFRNTRDQKPEDSVERML